MINELLSYGEENARTGRQLAELLGVDIRAVTLQIKKEREQGFPICATSSGESSGYFLTDSPEVLQDYCNRLYHRGGELFKMRRALLKVLENMNQQGTIESGQ